MDFNKILVTLKRFAFNEKMKLSQIYSTNILTSIGLIKIEELVNKPLPWELNTFALFSILSDKEYNNNTFEGKSVKKFYQILNSIRDSQYGEVKFDSSDSNFLRNFLIITGLTQMILQEHRIIKYYRYSYIFNFSNENVNMKKNFLDEFSVPYEKFIILGLQLNMEYTEDNLKKGVLTQKRFEKILSYYPEVLNFLCIKREDFIYLQKKLIDNPKDYIMAYNYLYTYPFIIEKEVIHFPLPHVITEAVTTSLLSRLTSGNQELRSLFGKEVLESYMLHLTNSSNFFDDLKEEYSYTYKRNEKRTADLMIKKNNYTVLLECKAMSPKRNLRRLDEGSISFTVERLSDGMVQLFKNANLRFNKEYFPFGQESCSYSNNTFGIVIIFEDSYISREIIYKEVAKKLNMSIDSKDYKYLCSNFKFMSLHEYERIVFFNYDLFSLLVENRDNNYKWFDFTLMPNELRRIGDNEELSKFFDKLIKNITK